ncbi:hypothetical protein [Pseudomonas serbica]|uniref:hypothetical protein n=1 Tax=Pseudomonas serbica TaxID=2965074 RepID=UPI00237A31AC|nr:hypothetical protein [Pseudomonas serbica]
MKPKRRKQAHDQRSGPVQQFDLSLTCMPYIKLKHRLLEAGEWEFNPNIPMSLPV